MADVEPDTDEEYESDQEEEEPKKQKKERPGAPDDIGTCFMDTIKKINVKRAAFVLVLFIIVTSTTFIEIGRAHV